MTLTPGRRYVVTYQRPVQRKPRKIVLDFLEETPTHSIFGGHPFAGTVLYPKSWIITIKEAPKGASLGVA